MNIPENILQQVADEAFAAQGRIIIVSCPDPNNIWNEQATSRRAVIHHALSNPALAPFLAGVGEYTDEEIRAAWTVLLYGEARSFEDRLRAFLAALPRRESQALVDLKSDLDGWKDRAVSLEGQVNEAIARAEKAEAELSGLLDAANEESRKDHVKYSQLANKLEGAQAELAALKSAELGILRPIAEMPETVPDGCMAVFRWRDDFGSWVTGTCKPTNGFFALLRLPAAEATPPAEPAAQVPLGPEDVPPGSIVTNSADSWYKVKYVTAGGVRIDIQGSNLIDYEELKTDGWSINSSIPDSGRWDANAWRPCSKPGKELN